MSTIYKYALAITDDATVEMPRGAKVLAIESSLVPHALFLWAIVDPDAPLETRHFSVRGTGHPLGDVGKHLATIQAGPFVWHVFEPAS